MKSRHLSILVTVLLIGFSYAQQKDTSSRKPDSKIVSKLEEIVELRQRQLKTELLLAELGRGEIDNLITTLVDLSEARIAVLEEQGKPKMVIAELQKMVKTLQMRLKREELLVEEERRTSDELSKIRVAVLKAEVRLLRAEKN